MGGTLNLTYPLLKEREKEEMVAENKEMEVLAALIKY